MAQKRQPDEIDVAIMTELKKYPPSTLRQIGKIVNRSFITVRQRIDWLEREEYIQQAPNAPEGSPRSKILSEKGFRYLMEPHLDIRVRDVNRL
jgi:hypothetical protein